MLINQSVRGLLIAAMLLFFVAFVGPTLRAETMYVYDRDSLVFLSTDVVEGQIVRSYKVNQVSLVDVKVTLVHKGGFNKGQTVVLSDSDNYRKPDKGDVNPQPFAAGDRLVLFVTRTMRTEFNLLPKEAVIYAPQPGGIMLVQGDHVFGFSQWSNPGPYVANVPAKPVKLFRLQLRDSLRNTKEWARLIEAKQAELDVPRLLKLLTRRFADRSPDRFGARDYFTEQICIRFANTHDLILLGQALPLAKGYFEASILQRGFGTPEGRDFLLSRVTDDKEPMPARLRYARALHNAGTVYRSTLTNIRAHSNGNVGEANEGNSGYITRIAKAASASGKHEELCASLVRCIDFFGQGIVQSKPAPLMVDLRGALAALKELYDTRPPQELQFAIEKATAWDKNAYDKLKSPCGAFISILRPVDPAKYTKPEKPSLIFEYEYTTLLLSRDTEVEPSVVLVHQKTKKRFVLPTELRVRGWSTGGGSNSVVLPNDLPKGRYHVFLQLSDGDKVTSTGHHFAADL
jgi:hypothetical protein